VYETDFLPVRRRYGDNAVSTACAIAVRLTVESQDRSAIVVLGGGDDDTGIALVDHMRRYYDPETVDLVIATRPDSGHLDGLIAVLEQLKVAELLVHQPERHDPNAARYLDLVALEKLLAVADDNGTRATEPLAGMDRLDGQLRILGPVQAYY
jgi:hypothetical protein